MKRYSILTLLIGMLALLSPACGPSRSQPEPAVQVEAATETATATATAPPPTVEPTITPTPEPTIPPSPTPEPTATPTAAAMANNLPVFEDASVETVSESEVSYSTTASPEEIIAFYLEAIPELDNWVLNEEDSITEFDDENGALLRFSRGRDQLNVYLYAYEDKLRVSVNLYPAPTEADISQTYNLVFPDGAEVIEAYEIVGSEDRFHARFLTNLSVEEVVRFYQEAYPATAGWTVYGYEPARDVVVLYSLYLQKDEREIELILKPTEEGGGILATVSVQPIADYKDYNVPTELEPLILMVGDAKMEFAENNMAQFSSRKPVEAVRERYQTELEAQGWTFNGEESSGDRLTIGFEKEGKILILYLSHALLGGTDISLRVLG